MWDYVFSPKHMMFDAAAGVVFFLLFRVLLGSRQPSLLARMAFFFVALSASRWYLGDPGGSGRAMPSGYIGHMVAMCARENSRDACFCAVDAIEAQVGHPALTQLAVKAEVNMALPPQMVTALADCGG